MASASSNGTDLAPRDDRGTSLLGAVAFRAAAFVAGTFLLGIAITLVFGDDGMLGVLVGILYTLGGITVLIAAILAGVAAVRRVSGG